MFVLALNVLLSFLLGSLSFAILVSHMLGLPDPRSYGSGNPGATNILRGGGKWAAFFTLLGDCLKGWLAVYVAQFLAIFCTLGSVITACSMVAVFAGHIWPIFFRFHGGKGVATAAGILLAIHPLLGVCTVCVWCIIAYFFKYSSLAALIATVFGTICVLLFVSDQYISFAMCCIATLIIRRHHENIKKLLAGQEKKIGAGGIK